eukprot:1205852-Rhodomonas_salina.1
MALERIPADIRTEGGVARMSDPKMIKEIQAAVSIPVMAKCRIGHQVSPLHASVAVRCSGCCVGRRHSMHCNASQIAVHQWPIFDTR